MAKGWLDNYGKEDNYNDSSVSAPEGFRGDGYSNVGRNYSPAWGGQFQNGGKAKKQTEGDRAMKTAGKVAEAAYISSWLDKVPYAETVYDAYNFLESVNEGDLVGMGSNLVGALIPGFSGKVIENVAQEYLPKQPQLEKDKFKFNLKSSSSDRQKYLEQYGPGYLNHPGFIKHELYKKQNGGNVYPVNYVPQAAMGGSLPGATGHMYARIGAPSNGKYAKKTLASAQDGKKVKYGTPEYEEAYNKGEVITKEGVRSPILLDEVVVKGKKKDKNWLEQYADKIVDENKDAGVLGAILGTPISAVMSLPQLMGMKAFTGEMERPSEALDIKNPYGAMAVDAIADPANLIGVGELSGLSKLGKEKALAKLVASKESGLLSRTHKLNPWAFKPNPEAYYRGIGRTGLDDALESGYLRANNNKLYGEDVYMTPEFNMAKGQYSRNQPYSVGDIWGDDWKMVDPTDSKSYIAEIPKNKLTNPEVKGKLVTINKGPLPIDDVKLYKQDWLQGYKEVPKPASNFESEIDWAKWNKEIPENSELIKEYNVIEKTSKANGSWMKNPDGSAFQGTPEQFIQQNSENFKKAFPDYYGSKLHHRSKNEFDVFDENKFGSTDYGYHGKGIYTSEDARMTARYGDKPYELYVNSKNKGIDPDYNQFYKKNLMESLNTLEKKYLQDKSLPQDFPEHYPNIKEYNNTLDANFEKDINQLIKNKKQLDDYDLIKVGNEIVIPFDNIVKSAIGNNGMFDMANPNIYKAVVPGAIGLGAASQTEQKRDGGVIKDDMGQWAHPGEITEINSNDITMEGVPYDVLGISDTGDTKLMKPGKNYKFKGKKVTEYPMAKNGVNQQDEKSLQQLDQLTNFTNYNTKQPGGWLDTL